MEPLQYFAALAQIPKWVIVLGAVWVTAWKGLALWRAALLRQKWWFIALLLLNTLGILDIVYIFIVSRNKRVLVEVIEEK